MEFFTLDNKEILITGGTGSLGQALIRELENNYKVKGIRIYSRDEYKQWKLKKQFKGFTTPISYLIGDVRNYDRLYRACNGVDIVLNTAAMKQVPACEENPIEAIETNINGARNIINAAIDNKVKKVIHVSTDKAVYPINLYGATKTVAEKLFLHANTYTGGHGTIFSCIRYGNVLGSRGSIIPLFKEQGKTGTITITDKRMTRFFITLEEVSQFILSRIERSFGGEIFIPKMKSIKIETLVNWLFPECKIEEIGIRKGEKLHECLITKEESLVTSAYNNFFIIINNDLEPTLNVEPWEYTSEETTLTKEELLKMIKNTTIMEY